MDSTKIVTKFRKETERKIKAPENKRLKCLLSCRADLMKKGKTVNLWFCAILGRTILIVGILVAVVNVKPKKLLPPFKLL